MCLVGLASVATFGVVSAAGSAAFSDDGSHFFYDNFFLSLFYSSEWVLVCENQFINIVSISFYNFIEFIVLLYSCILVVTSFCWYKKYMICLISFSNFSDVLPAFACGSGIGNIWSICLGDNFSFSACLEVIKSFTKSNGFWYLK